MESKSNKNQVNYNEFLIKMIPNLANFSYLAGSEGKVYFVSDKFVIKEYFSLEEDPIMFDGFCKEIQSFANAGYCVPKIYACQTLPTIDGNQFYLMEERIEGKSLFQINFSQFYKKFKHLCSQEEFEKITTNKYLNSELYEEVLAEQVRDFIATNSDLCTMPEENLENFIMSDYQMAMQALYSISDIQDCNVLFDGKKLTSVDSAFLGTKKLRPDSQYSSASQTISDMFYLFDNNAYLKSMINKSPVKSQTLTELKNQNDESCGEAMYRFVKKSIDIVGKRSLYNYEYYACVGSAKGVSSPVQAKRVIDLIEREM